MERKITSQVYSYKDVTMPNGITINADKVTVKDNKVHSIEDAVAVSESQGTFNFSINPYGLNGTRTLSISSAQEGVDAQAIAWAFVKMVEEDIANL